MLSGGKLDTCDEERVMPAHGRVYDVLALQLGDQLRRVTRIRVAKTKLAAIVPTYEQATLSFITQTLRVAFVSATDS